MYVLVYTPHTSYGEGRVEGGGGGRGGRAQSLSHVLSAISGARRAVDSVGLRSPMDLLACASERALHAGGRAACSGAYADA